MRDAVHKITFSARAPERGKDNQCTTHLASKLNDTNNLNLFLRAAEIEFQIPMMLLSKLSINAFSLIVQLRLSTSNHGLEGEKAFIQ